MAPVLEEHQIQTLHKFQDIVSDLGHDEMTCLRFLIARNYDLKKAEEMLRNHTNWRNHVKIEYLTHEWKVPDFISTDFEYTFMGQSRNGGPVFWVPGGRWNVRKYVEQGKKDEILMFAYKMLETALLRMKERGYNKIVTIYGFEGLTYYKVSNVETTRVVYAAFQALEQNYPELLQNVIVVNAPMVFHLVWNVLKPILSPKTLEKIQVFGCDKTKYIPALREICRDDVIPPEYL